MYAQSLSVSVCLCLCLFLCLLSVLATTELEVVAAVTLVVGTKNDADKSKVKLAEIVKCEYTDAQSLSNPQYFNCKSRRGPKRKKKVALCLLVGPSRLCHEFTLSARRPVPRIHAMLVAHIGRPLRLRRFRR